MNKFSVAKIAVCLLLFAGVAMAQTNPMSTSKSQVLVQGDTQTVQANDNSTLIVFTGSTPATSATVNLPVSPQDDQRERIFSQAGIATLTISPTAGQFIINAPTTLAPNGSTEIFYQLQSKTWFRIE